MKNIGLWIDDQEAVIVTLQNGREETRKIFSVVEKPIRVAPGKRPPTSPSAKGSPPAEVPDPQPGDPLDIYYGGIITLIRDAESILIFGPGGAKSELDKRLRHADLGSRIVGVESVDQMTIPQVSAKVTLHYRNN